MKSKTVGAREANQRFSKLLAAAEAGRETTITKRGKPVARLVPIGRTSKAAAEREAALERMLDAMREGVPLGGRGFTRDEMHER